LILNFGEIFRIINLAPAGLWAGTDLPTSLPFSRYDGAILLIVLFNPGQLEQSFKQQGINV